MSDEQRRQELLDEIRRKELMASIRQKEVSALTESEQPQEVPEPVDDRSFGTKLRDRATALTQGASWNWGDELTSAVAATAGMFGDDESTWGERYQDILSAENARYGQFMDERPGEALGLELAGGFLSRRPAGLGPTGAIKQGRKLLYAGRPQKLVQATRNAARKRVMARQELANSGITRRLRKAATRNMGQGIAEGAIAGAGANYEDRGQGAAFGGAIGAALPLALNTGTGAVKTIAKQRITQELGKGLNFIPIHLAAKVGESSIANFYRDFLGRAFGSKTAMAKQEARVTEPLEENVAKAQRHIEEAEDNLTASTQRKKEINEQVSAEAQGRATDTRLDYEQKRWDATDNAQQQLDDVNRRAQNQADDWDNYPEGLAESEAQRLRSQATDAALPSRADADFREEVMQTRTRTAREMMKQWWNENGFSSVKDRKFQFGGGVNNRIRKLMENDPDMAYGLRNTFDQEAEVINAVRKARGQDPLTGDELEAFLSGGKWIDGDVMMSLRNFFAKRANRPGPAAEQNRAVANMFDKDIRRQMGEGSQRLKDFNEDIQRWRAFRQFDDSVDIAIDRGRQGDFIGDDWIAKRRRGRPLSEMDVGAIEGQEVLKEAQRAARLGKQEVGRQAAQERSGISRAKGVLTRALGRDQRAELKRQGRESLADPRRQAAEADVVGARAQKREATREKRWAQKAMSEIGKRITPKKSTPAQQIAATAAIGALAGAMIPGASLLAAAGTAVASGIAVSSMLSSPSVQRAFAGQSWFNKAARQMIDVYEKTGVDIPEQFARYEKAGMKMSPDQLKLKDFLERTKDAYIRQKAARNADR